jgi:hypothetical protein
MAIGVVQGFLQEAEDADTLRCRQLHPSDLVGPRDLAASALLVRGDRQFNDCREIGSLDLRQYQATADAANLRHRLVKARSYGGDFFAACSDRRVAVDQRFAVHPQGRECDELGRTVMQVCANAPEIAFVDGRSAARRLLYSLPERSVLGKQSRQLGDASGQCLALALDGAAAAKHDAG